MENVTVLDTCVLFDFLSGHNKPVTARVERLLLEARGAVSVITVFELLRGVTADKHLAQRRELIALCTVLDVTLPISQRAADIYTDLKKKGSLIHTEDILIAATSLHWRYPLMTSNIKDFSRIPGVKFDE